MTGLRGLLARPHLPPPPGLAAEPPARRRWQPICIRGSNAAGEFHLGWIRQRARLSCWRHWLARTACCVRHSTTSVKGSTRLMRAAPPSPTSSRKHVGWNWDCRAVPCITWPRLQTSLHELLQQTKKSKDHRSYYDATAAVQAMDEVLNLLSHRERESVCVCESKDAAPFYRFPCPAHNRGILIRQR